MTASVEWFTGIDWGTATHEVRVVNLAGEVVGQRTVRHAAAELEQLVEWLATLSGQQLDRVAVAIETPRGAVVDLLLERGCAVFAVNPKQLDRFRDRFSVAGAKDDPLDALVLASALRTDRGLFRPLAVEAPMVIRLREVGRAERILQAEFMALTNQLRDLVHRITPSWLELSPNADDPWFWSLLMEVATPALGRGLRRRKVTHLLAQHRIRRWAADDVFAAVGVAPLVVAPGTIEAVTTHITLLLPRVRLVHEQRQLCRRQLETMLDEWEASGDDDLPPTEGAAAGPPVHDVAIMRSLPGLGTLNVSAFLADAWQLLVGRDYPALRAVSGVAPVRRQTGKNKRGAVSMRQACNHRLREACFHWANISTHHDAPARAYYATLRARGHSHGRALRSVADRWLRILIAMLKTRTVYDPTRFATAEQPAIG
jgi:transposase